MQAGRWGKRTDTGAERATPERARILFEEAEEAEHHGAYAEARTLYGESQALYRKLARCADEAEAVVRKARCTEEMRGEHKEVRALYEEAISIYRAAQDDQGLADTLTTLGAFALDRSNTGYAVKLLQEAAALYEKVYNKLGAASALYLLAAALLCESRAQESHDFQRKAELARVGTRESLPMAEAIARLAGAAGRSGDVQRAAPLFRESLRQFRSTGYLAGLAPALLRSADRVCLDGWPHTLCHLADALKALYGAQRTGRHQQAALRDIGGIALRLGDSSTAYAFFKESMTLSQDYTAWYDRAASYVALGCAAAREEHDDIARSLYDKAFTTLKENSSGVDQVEHTLKMCRRVLYTEDLNAAALYFARCASQARSLGEVVLYTQTMYYRGVVALQQGDYGAANRHLEECMIYYGDVGPLRRLGRTIAEKGSAMAAQGDVEKGRTFHHRALEIARSEQDETGEVSALIALGSWAMPGSNYSFELACLHEAAARCAGREERQLNRTLYCGLGDLMRRRGDYDGAAHSYLKCVLILGQEGRMAPAAAALEGLAAIVAATGMHRESARLLGKADALRRRTGTAPTELNAADIEAAVSTIRSGMPEADFDDARKAGEVFSVADTIQQAWSVVEALGKRSELRPIH